MQRYGVLRTNLTGGKNTGKHYLRTDTRVSRSAVSGHTSTLDYISGHPMGGSCRNVQVDVHG